MHSLASLLFSGLLCSKLTLAAPAPQIETLAPRAATCNTATNRACWSAGFDINTDYELNTPVTGVTVSTTLTLTEVTNWLGPDGVVKKTAMLVNGNILGPTIVANWGDNIKITLINNMVSNGTSIHWHGMRQVGSNLQDGVNGVTECPIPPVGGTRTYSFLATQYGTSWYHSHFSAQYGNGIVGSMVINGPASLPYDIDLGPFPISDYYYASADELIEFTKTQGAPASDNVLFNGLGKHPITGDGEYASLTFTPGKRHRLRFVNPSVENHFQISIVGHQMTIIETDLVPVNTFSVDSLFIAPGQRYDVIIDASQPVDNYWLNVTFGGSGFCGTSVNPHPAAIIRYDGAPTANPTDVGTVPVDHQCLDLINFTPVVSRIVPTGFAASADNTLKVSLDLAPTFVWRVNGGAIDIDWDAPVAQYVANNDTAYPTTDNMYAIETEDEWVYWLIENDPSAIFGLPHPIHLHGHDFVVIGRSPDATPLSQTPHTFDPSLINVNNPTRRDVAMLPPKGWLLIAFKADNPGAWLMHCHIAWHVGGGLGVTFLERVADYRAGLPAADVAQLNNQCDAWNAWFPAKAPFPVKNDSGL